jgi:hypothetical protein
VNDPLAQIQLWKKLNAGNVLVLNGCTLSLCMTDDGTYRIETPEGDIYDCSSIGDAAIKLITMHGEIVKKQG